MEIKNAVIERTILGIEDHGIMTCYLHLKYDGPGQGFGGYILDTLNETINERIGTAWGMEFVRRVLKTIEVDSWEKLTGKYCRVEADRNKIYRIGHIIKDKWFNPEIDLANMKER